MNRSLLVTRPDSDLTTRYISAWAKKIIDIAKRKCVTVFDLDRGRACRREFESMIKKHQPDLVFLNGHGNDNCVTGQEKEVLLKAGENDTVLREKTVYALSCRSGKELGSQAIQSGARAYIGYDEDFIFLYDENRASRPSDDAVAQLFLEPSNQVMVSLLKDHTPQEAHHMSKQSFARQIKKLLTSESTPIGSAAVRYLVWDMQHQVCCEKKES